MFSIVFFVSPTQFHKNSQFNEEPRPYLAHLSLRTSAVILTRNVDCPQFCQIFRLTKYHLQYDGRWCWWLVGDLQI